VTLTSPNGEISNIHISTEGDLVPLYVVSKHIQMKNKTLVLGASDNPGRYSNMAMLKLRDKGHAVVAVGRRGGQVSGMEILSAPPVTDEIDTVTLYLNPDHQQAYYDYILSLKPRRIIFNPGTENDELEELAAQKGIEVREACTLVMLGTGQY
jgi:uncharacterized protein